MCLTIISKNKPQSKIAETDIIVYKRIMTEDFEPYNPLIDRTPESDKAKPYIYNDEITYIKGIVMPKVELKVKGQELDADGMIICWDIKEGYHSYVDNKHFKVNSVFKIPKGTEYYTDGIENVSETIVFVDWLEGA